MGEFGKSGELGKPGTESGAERRARFLRGEEGAVMRDMRVRRRGFARRVFGRRVMSERDFAGVGMSGKARRVMPEREFAE